MISFPPDSFPTNLPASSIYPTPKYLQLGNLQEPVFDELVVLLAKLCRVPIAFISLIKAETVWFKHTIGWTGAERLPLDHTLCSLAMLQQTPTFFPDLLLEPCEQINSTEIEALGLRFYLGIPLRTRQGNMVGVLAILDQQPRQPKVADYTLLEGFASLASVLFDLYRAVAQPTHTSLLENHQVYEAISQTMRCIHRLTERGGSTPSLKASAAAEREVIALEAHKLAYFIRHYLTLPYGSSPPSYEAFRS